MGADFSLLRMGEPSQEQSANSTRSRRRSSRARRKSDRHPGYQLMAYPDSSTLANTLANRSPTPVARHVALARLADRLTAMGKSRREHVIEQLHIPTNVLREVSRYTPSNSFGSAVDDELLSERLSERDDRDESEREESERDESESEANDIDSELSASPASTYRESPPRPRKIVSFAKYAEMRLFRD